MPVKEITYMKNGTEVKAFYNKPIDNELQEFASAGIKVPYRQVEISYREGANK